ncbi:MAG: MoaD/ThiS family protein, partial [Thermoplasmata archaeon]|nr:MoaD/ThiS family protein [Thermoplasmata archaeon]
RSARVLLFATAREALGRSELVLAVPVGGIPVGEFLRPLTERYPPLARILKASRLVRNGEYVRGNAVRVMPGDELAIHPPYSGG